MQKAQTLDMPTDRLKSIARATPLAAALLCLPSMLAACHRPAPTPVSSPASTVADTQQPAIAPGDQAPEDSAAPFRDASLPSDPAAFARALFADDGIDETVWLNGDLRTRYFTPELAGLVADTVHDDPTRLQSNPLCLCSAPKALAPTVTATVLDADRALVHVKVARTGTAESPTIPLILVLSQEPEGWKLADVLYPQSHESLRKILAKANADDLEVRAPV